MQDEKKAWDSGIVKSQEEMREVTSRKLGLRFLAVPVDARAKRQWERKRHKERKKNTVVGQRMRNKE